ncbi:MAG: type II toxin-antitoxin system PemK/MazF family toxin [Candidatus Micrarchaeota archaeon]|nr:type II toxin-antitoxin system PemK/MazF family toxin [Candidatus Micrarchaeota archaeon]
MIGPSKVEVWRVDLSGTRGHEQEKERPALVWRDLDHVKMAIIIPFTRTVERENLRYTHLVTPTRKNGLTDESIALVFQIRAIGKERLVKKIGELEEDEITSIGAILKDLLRL